MCRQHLAAGEKKQPTIQTWEAGARATPGVAFGSQAAVAFT